MRSIFLIIVIFLFCNPIYAAEVAVEIPENTIFGVQPLDDLFFRHHADSQKPFPYQTYIIRTSVPNPLFERTDQSEIVTIKSADIINIVATLNLISYSRNSNSYKFELALEQKIILEKTSNFKPPVFKEIPAFLMFAENKSNKLVLQDKFELTRAADKTLSKAAGNDVKLFVDRANYLSMHSIRPLKIFVKLNN